MEKQTAIRVLPGSHVLFRGQLYEVVSVRSAGGIDAPYFRLRSVQYGTPTDLISHKLIEPAKMPEQPV